MSLGDQGGLGVAEFNENVLDVIEIVGMGQGEPVSTVNRFGGTGLSGFSTSDNRRITAPRPGKIRRLAGKRTFSGGGTRNGVILINGIASTATIELSGLTYSEIDANVAFVEGDLISLRTSGGGSTDRVAFTVVIEWL